MTFEFRDERTNTLIICKRCGRKPDPTEPFIDTWNVVFRHGMIRYLCAQCQTSEDHAEADVNSVFGLGTRARSLDASAPVADRQMAFIHQLHGFASDHWMAWLKQTAALPEGAVAYLDPAAIAESALVEMREFYPVGFPTDEAIVRNILTGMVVDLVEDTRSGLS